MPGRTGGWTKSGEKDGGRIPCRPLSTQRWAPGKMGPGGSVDFLVDSIDSQSGGVVQPHTVYFPISVITIHLSFCSFHPPPHCIALAFPPDRPSLDRPSVPIADDYILYIFSSLPPCTSSPTTASHQEDVTMSAAHPQQQQPRTLRTTRVAANTARPLQQTQQHRPLSGSLVHPKTTSHEPQNGTNTATTGASAPGPSSLSLFLRNLRLLDLDLLPDWPGISPDTFAATGLASAQGQKQRIQCVEWALFRLFSLWDPEETANVGHFFPMFSHRNLLIDTNAEAQAVLSST